MYYEIATLVTGLHSLGTYVGDVWPLVVALIAAVGGARWSGKKIIHRVKGWFESVIDVKIEPVLENQAKVAEQFKNNGGSSMKDAIDRLDVKLDKSVSVMAEHTASDASNFDHITTTLLTLVQGQAAARSTAIEVKNDLDTAHNAIEDAVVVATEDVKQAIADKTDA